MTNDSLRKEGSRAVQDAGGHPVLIVYDPVEDRIRTVRADELGLIGTQMYVWDSNLLAPVKWDSSVDLGADMLLNEDDDASAEDLTGLVTMSVLMARLSESATKPLRMDSCSHSLQTITYPHHKIHEGNHFFVSGYQDLTTGNVLDFQWTIPDTTKWVHWVWEIDTEDEFEWFVYEGVSVVNALANTITPLNSNRNSATVSGTTMRYEVQTNLAAANADTDVESAILLDSGVMKLGTKFVAGGGGSTRDKELILKQNTVYCLRTIANADGFINFSMQWYEHTSKD